MILAAGPSFLTDVLTMALCLIAWTFFAEALRSPEDPSTLRKKVIIGSAFALLAALNRQNVILPFGVAMLIISGFRPAWRSILIPSAAVIIAAGLLAVALIGKLPYAVPVHPVAGLLTFIGWPDITIKFMVKFGITSGLLVLPAVLLGFQLRKPSWPMAGLVLAWLLVFIILPMTARHIEMFAPIFRLTVNGQYWITMGVVVGGVHGFGCWTVQIAGGFHPPNTDSRCSATAKATSSRNGRATTCRPMGRSPSAPHRTTTAGHPVML
jgi:hypothetical protein